MSTGQVPFAAAHERLAKRNELEAAMKAKRAVMEAKAAEHAKARAIEEAKELAAYRKTLVHKARPNPLAVRA